MSKSLMTTNIYTCRGTIAVAGACLEETSPRAYQTVTERADQVYTLCLEESHINMAVTKLTAILSTGQVTGILFATVDRSPHCTQMHYIMHEIRRTLKDPIPAEHYVVRDDVLIPVSDDAIELSKTLSELTARTAERNTHR